MLHNNNHANTCCLIDSVEGVYRSSSSPPGGLNDRGCAVGYVEEAGWLDAGVLFAAGD